MAKTILIIVSNPLDTQKLQVNKEFKAIKKIFEGNDHFIVEDELAATPNDLLNALLKHKPHILHFIGHGEGEEGICLENENGLRSVVSIEKLANIFKHFSAYIECVFLNACKSIVQAETINEYVNYVIGMQDNIRDDTARAFSTGFYQAIAKNEDYEAAFKFAKLSLEINDFEGIHIPQLLSKITTNTLKNEINNSQPNQNMSIKTSTVLYNCLRKLPKPLFNDICFYLKEEYHYDLSFVDVSGTPADVAHQLLEFLKQYPDGFEHLQQLLEKRRFL